MKQTANPLNATSDSPQGQAVPQGRPVRDRAWLWYFGVLALYAVVYHAMDVGNYQDTDTIVRAWIWGLSALPVAIATPVIVYCRTHHPDRRYRKELTADQKRLRRLINTTLAGTIVYVLLMDFGFFGVLPFVAIVGIATCAVLYAKCGLAGPARKKERYDPYFDPWVIGDDLDPRSPFYRSSFDD